jgi:hypothetical protein
MIRSPRDETHEADSGRHIQLSIPFLAEELDDEQSLGWWERRFAAGCEQRLDREGIVKRLGATLRELRDDAAKNRRKRVRR